MSFLPHQTGWFDLRVGVAGSALSPAYVSSAGPIHVYSYSPRRPRSDGADLLALDKQFCYTIADEISRLSVVEPPAYGFVVDLAGKVYKKSECDKKAFAAALREGFTEAALNYIIGRFKDKAAEAAWGPELDRILRLARVRDAFIGAELKQLWNDWILNAIAQVFDRSNECFDTHKFPAHECAFWPKAVGELEDHLIR